MGGYAAGLPQINSSGGGSVINLSDVVDSEYGESNTVSSGILVTVVSYTVGATITQLMNAEFGGSNIAQYKLLINGVTKSQFYTYFGEGLTGTWDFRALDNGLLLTEGDIVTVTTIHGRPMIGDFYARLNFLLITPSM